MNEERSNTRENVIKIVFNTAKHRTLDLDLHTFLKLCIWIRIRIKWIPYGSTPCL